MPTRNCDRLFMKKTCLQNKNKNENKKHPTPTPLKNKKKSSHVRSGAFRKGLLVAF